MQRLLQTWTWIALLYYCLLDLLGWLQIDPLKALD